MRQYQIDRHTQRIPNPGNEGRLNLEPAGVQSLDCPSADPEFLMHLEKAPNGLIHGPTAAGHKSPRGLDLQTARRLGELQNLALQPGIGRWVACVPIRDGPLKRGVPCCQKSGSSQDQMFDAISNGPASRPGRSLELAFCKARCKMSEVCLNRRNGLETPRKVILTGCIIHVFIDRSAGIGRWISRLSATLVRASNGAARLPQRGSPGSP
jgi:hypothetical protein